MHFFFFSSSLCYFVFFFFSLGEELGACTTTMDPNQTLFTLITQKNESFNGRLRYYNTCIDLPPKITSEGIWASHTTGASPSHSSFTILELQIISIFVTTQSFHFFLKRLGFPYFISQVMVCIPLLDSLF